MNVNIKFTFKIDFLIFCLALIQINVSMALYSFGTVDETNTVIKIEMLNYY